jgi:hypothetical protein
MGQEQFSRGNVQASALEAGRWKNIPFNLANFNSGTLTWKLTKDDIQVNRYMRVGNTIFWNLIISNLSELVGATPVNFLSLIAPVKIFSPNYSSLSMGTISNPGQKVCAVAMLAENVVAITQTHARVSIAPSAQIVAGFTIVSFVATYECGVINL